jgi:cytochrome c biogenesis protein CcmG, thiol:disulfide interchange protein DsbE
MEMTQGRTAALLALALALTSFDSMAGDALIVGKPAPNFHVTTYDGTQLTLADFKGQVLLVNFWATWCGPCKSELPMLDAYYRAQKNTGLRMIAITTEDSLPSSQLQKLAAVMTIPMVRRFKGEYAWVKALPTNYIVDRAGVLRYAKAGALSLEDLNELLVPLLQEPAPGS